MNITIKMLNVKDGDAIIVYLKREEKKFLIVIDGGHAGDGNAMISALQPFLIDSKKKAPDLFICTHYDSDHIRGFVKVFKHFYELGGRDSLLWLHTPGLGFKSVLEEASKLKSILNNSSIEKSIIKDQQLYNSYMLVEGNKEAQLVIESYSDLKDFYDYLSEKCIKYVEPLKSKKPIPEWPEIQILGPTREYYELLFPSGSAKRLLKEELDHQVIETLNEGVNKKLQDPCKYLDAHGGKSITSTNKASVILLITVDHKKFLFTGDAGLESFDRANAPEEFRNLYWLKVPHHGSRNNLNSNWIKTFSPKHAYVSGKNHTDDEVIGCLEKHGAKVKSTKHLGADLDLIE